MQKLFMTKELNNHIKISESRFPKKTLTRCFVITFICCIFAVGKMAKKAKNRLEKWQI